MGEDFICTQTRLNERAVVPDDFFRLFDFGVTFFLVILIIYINFANRNEGKRMIASVKPAFETGFGDRNFFLT